MNLQDLICSWNVNYCDVIGSRRGITQEVNTDYSLPGQLQIGAPHTGNVLLGMLTSFSIPHPTTGNPELVNAGNNIITALGFRLYYTLVDN